MAKKAKFGIGIPTGEEGLMYPIPFASARDNILIAQEAEKAGFHSVWGNDHVTTQNYVRKEFDRPPRYYSPPITLAAIAEATTTIKVATALLVAPFRHPVMVAKEIATLDQLSQGRVLLGIGIGAYIEEFRNMFGSQVDGFHRGDMLDEMIPALRALWEGKPCSFKGKYYEFNDVESFPTPVQAPLPLYIGGNSPEGRRRVAEYGQGWLPAALPPEEIKQGLKEIHEWADKLGRDLTGLEVAPQQHIYMAKTSEEAHKKFEQTQMHNHLKSLKNSTMKNQKVGSRDTGIIGSVEEIREKVGKYIEAGVTTFPAIIFSTNTLPEMLDMARWFAEDVMPEFV